MRMGFDQFAQEVVEKIREYLPESFKTASVQLQTVMKNNDVELTGLSICREGSNAYPTIYLEEYFQRYVNGENMSRLLESIASVRMQHEDAPIFDVSQVFDYEQAKEKIVPRLVSLMWNRALLEDRPHTVIADLAVTYHILLGDTNDVSASIAVTNSIMQQWGVDVEELHRQALYNLPHLLPTTFQTMGEVIHAMLGGTCNDTDVLMDGVDVVDEKMFVLSNSAKMHGAAAILDKNMMQKILQKFGEDFYILPSSIHEVLIVKADPHLDQDALTSMVKEVNSSEVSSGDQLSDHIYRYTASEGLCAA